MTRPQIHPPQPNSTVWSKTTSSTPRIATTIGRTGSGTVSYDDITALTLNASNGTNKISVTGMPAASGPVLLNAGAGADTLDLSAAALNPVKVTLSEPWPITHPGLTKAKATRPYVTNVGRGRLLMSVAEINRAQLRALMGAGALE